MREEFEKSVRPILANRCWGCHRQSPMAGLQLDSREAILKGGKSGPAIVPGKPAESILIQAITHEHARLKMPPPGKLPETEIATLKAWVERGAWWPADDAKKNERVTEYQISAQQRAFW